MTALVAFSVLNSVHTKNGVYGWTGLEFYAFKIKMCCSDVQILKLFAFGIRATEIRSCHRLLHNPSFLLSL